MHAGQPAWWSPTNITVPWHDMFPCRQAMAVTVCSVNNKEGTALVEYLDVMRQPIQHLAQIQDLRPRELCK